VLFRSMAYKEQPFPKRLRLPIQKQHSNRRIALFT
jgi:hypothetical protein